MSGSDAFKLFLVSLLAAWLLFLLAQLAFDPVGRITEWAGPDYSGVTLEPRTSYATTRDQKVLKWLAQGKDGSVELNVLQDANPPPIGPEKPLVAIHGYNVLDNEIASYFVPFTAHMRAADAGSGRSYVVFDWDSSFSVPVRTGNLWFVVDLFDSLLVDTIVGEYVTYRRARRNAAASGAPLLELIERLNRHTGKKVDVVAHSMGGYLVLEALKSRPESARLIDRLILLAPAVEHDAFESAEARTIVSLIEEVHVFHSRKDTILATLGRLRHGSAMMGSDGPMRSNAPAKNVIVHDVTESLGDENVHGAYLRPEGAQRIGLAGVLR